MQGISEFISEGGPFMYLIALVVLPLIVIGIFHIVAPRKWSMIAMWCLLFLPILIGGAGTLRGRAITESAAGYVNPDEKEELLQHGYQEANNPLIFGAGVSGLGVLPLVIGEIRRRRKRLP